MARNFEMSSSLTSSLQKVDIDSRNKLWGALVASKMFGFTSSYIFLNRRPQKTPKNVFILYFTRISLSKNTLSENTLLENTLSENTLLKNTLSENTLSENKLLEEEKTYGKYIKIIYSQYQTVPDCTRLCPTVLVCIGLLEAIPGCIRLYQSVLDYTRNVKPGEAS